MVRSDPHRYGRTTRAFECEKHEEFVAMGKKQGQICPHAFGGPHVGAMKTPSTPDATQRPTSLMDLSDRAGDRSIRVDNDDSGRSPWWRPLPP